MYKPSRLWSIKMPKFFKLFTLSISMVVAMAKAEPSINCTDLHNCGNCIRQFGCIWCADPETNLKRCQNENETTCAIDFIINPKINYVIITSSTTSEKMETSGKKKTNVQKTSKNILPVTPQMVNLTIRPNAHHPFRIKMRYHQPSDYPLDIYYLMDSSNSLLTEKYNLAMTALGTELAKKISKITKDFRLGFGSFIDKPVSPFISLVPKINEKPCDNCIPPYGFRNYLRLTQNINYFSRTVSSLKMSSNLDKPEGGLDGIMQATVCRKEIGWRDNARKLLIYSTDDAFHIAGDGRLGGVLTPNDGCCHLDKNGYYVESSNMDYPSIAQLGSKVRENSINLIFAVPKNHSTLYKKFASFIDGASVGVKSEGGNYTDVIRLITEQYEKITSAVEIRENNLPEQIKIHYYSKCLNSSGPLMNTNKCEGLKINDSVEFEIDIELMTCPNEISQRNNKFYLQPVGIDEKMTINLKMICDCKYDINDHQHFEKNSSKCSGHGTFEFGICDCNPGYSDRNCSCPFEEDTNDNCRPTPNAAICSNRGSCKCNKCKCDAHSPSQVYWGQFCQCSNFSCPYIEGKLCSGNGNCVCNECVCNKGWSGEDCSCEDSTERCVTGSNGEICSEHGDCVCNKCVCNQTGGFSGRYCDKCPTCPTRCEEFKKCTLCKINPNMKCTDICKNNVKMVDNLEDYINQEDFIRCTEFDNQNCRFMYAYKVLGKQQIEIKIQTDKHCESGFPIWKLVIGVISAIVMFGFVCLLIWKIFVVIQDRKEFSKFEEERAKALWKDSHNPLYIAPSTRYHNPLFEERSEWSYKSNKTD